MSTLVAQLDPQQGAQALIGQIGEQQAAGFMLTLCRVGPLFLLAPLFSSKMMPPRAKGIAAVAIALGMAPLAMGGGKIPTDVVALGGLALKEVLVGLVFAFSVAAVIAAIQVAGSIVDTLSGFAFGTMLDPITGAQSAVMFQLYTVVGIAIFVAIGGDAWVLQGLARTYEAVPVDQMPDLGALIGGAHHAFVSIFGAAVEVAAPVVLALVLTDAAFGLVSRVVPQMNVFVVGFPAKIMVALLIMAATLPFMGSWVTSEVEASVRQALQSIRVA